MKYGVIIVAGGKGQRMGADIPKQFLLLKGKPILMYTIERFYSLDSSMEIVVVLPESEQDYWRQLCQEYKFSVQHKITSGGKTRFHSVQNGLRAIVNSEIVGVHDGVRPFVSEQTLKNCYNTAKEKGTAIPVMPVIESIRKIDGEVSESCDRSKYRLVQTPQVFEIDLLRRSYNVDYLDTFTDDASVVEAEGYLVSLVEGNIENIKITSPMDLAVGEYFVMVNKLNNQEE